jgi:hypothetical protein
MEDQLIKQTSLRNRFVGFKGRHRNEERCRY